MHVASLDGFLHAVLPHHIHDGRVCNHTYGFIQADFAAIVELVFDVKDDFSLSKSFTEEIAVTDGQKHVPAHLLQVNVHIQREPTLTTVSQKTARRRRYILGMTGVSP